MSTLELISHDLCPFVQRAVIALAEKGVPFVRTNVDLDNRPQWFKDLSPLGKVPLLRVGKSVIFESSVILEYLEETQSPPLHPHDPLTRAQHRAWMEFGSSVLMDNYGLIFAPDAAALQAQVATVRGKFQRLEAVLGRGPYFAGEAFSLVDAVFAPAFRYWDAFDRISDFAVFEALPKVQAWRRALAQRPSVRDGFTADFDERVRKLITTRGANGHFASLVREQRAA